MSSTSLANLRCSPRRIPNSAPNRRWSLRWLVIASLVMFGATGGRCAQAADYPTDVKPLLKERCYACHGALKQEGGLRVDTAAAMLEGGDSGPAIVAGKAAESLLLARVSATDADERMPPEHEGELLDAEQLQQLLSWIEAGAEAPEDELPELSPDQHWAFQPLSRPEVPVVPEHQSWIFNPIDAFLAEQYVAQGIKPVERATIPEQIRRLYLDLTGLPPTPHELTAALKLAEDDAAWHLRLSAELLESPQHGERWARHWMDIWRYSDWWGLGDQLRNSQQHIWHWRDWIIDSLNADIPYDEMIHQMLAADELYPTDIKRLRATGYLARNYFLFNRNQWMDETVEHVSKAFLGLTMNCAKCHDHKYDPITQEDYYHLRAVFEPYHVRLDMLPEEVDLARNGLPRVYDGWPDAPTYRFIRGEEKRPDTSRALQAAIPTFFDFATLEVQSVDLPPTAWQPGRRPWVLQNYCEQAERHTADARQRLDQLNEKLQQLSAREQVPQPTSDEASSDESPAVSGDGGIIQERFEQVDSQRWTTMGGEWSVSPDGLEQHRDESQTAYLELNQLAPVDFEADLHFTIRGGTPYRSVGIAFDRATSQAESQASPEFMVYASAHAASPKLQVAYRRGGENWQYPSDALQSLQIGVDQPLHINLQVRGRLVNTRINQGPILAWHLPVERQPGRIALTTFTAQVVFREFSLRSLPASSEMVDPEAERLALERRTLPLEIEVARASLHLAETELRLYQACQELRASQESGADEVVIQQQHWQTLCVQRHRAWARQEMEVAKLRLEEAKPNGDQSEIAKRLETAQAENARLQERYHMLREAAPTNGNIELEAVEFPVGAKWSATRFQLSTTDDPDVPFPETSTGRRTALAKWITDRSNPLTARVAVNHLWSRHFGSSLLAAEFDLGRNQPRPVQHKLLDWLAVEFMESGWSMKHMHRLIVASSAYRMSSTVEGAEQQLAVDPDNRLLWYRVPIRLESQVIRDALLMHAGQLELTLGGPSVSAAEQEASKRRSLYFFHSNNERNLWLTTFDEARVQECYRREQSIVPQQALALSNSRLVLENTARIAERVTKGDGSDRAFVHNAFTWLLGNSPNPTELATCLKALKDWQQQGETAEVARTDLIWTLVNHHDFVTLR